MNVIHTRVAKLMCLLALVACLVGLWLMHQVPAIHFAPLSGKQTEPGQLDKTPNPLRSRPSPCTSIPTEKLLSTPTKEEAMRHPITLTVVYDNNPFDARLKTAWGFACIVETDEATVLFDTGGDGPTLMGNLSTLGIDPRRIDIVFLSHYHADHTGGLDALLNFAEPRAVYVPQSFPSDFKEHVAKRVRQVIEVHEPLMITDQIRTTGELGTSIIEQSLIVETSKGLVVITGCAHPGIVEIVRWAKTYGEVYLALGGFHLMNESASRLKSVVAALKELGVQEVAPCHCTGNEARQLFSTEFGTKFIPTGVGTVITRD